MNSQSSGKGKLIVFGFAFYYPLAGVTYQYLHYLLGLRKLGFDVYYVEDSDWPVYDPRTNEMTDDPSYNVRQVGQVLDEYGFAGRWAFRHRLGPRDGYGLSSDELNVLYNEADACLNVCGAQEIRDEHLRIPCRVYVESDPFASQVRVAQGDDYWIGLLGAHTHHFSFGENLGQPDCPAPIERFTWHPTRQPVAMELWEDAPPVGGTEYTTITTWSNKGNDVEFQGETYYWTKNFAFERMIDLPQRRPQQKFGIAVKSSPTVMNKLAEHGWRLTNSLEVSANVDAYKSFIQSSRGEFTVARDQYVRGRTGWQSDRSVCYLAAGRPVITEDTGFGKFVPTGEGLFAFSNMNEALAAIDTIESNYEQHCAAARDIAYEYLAAEKVLHRLLVQAGLS